MEKTIIAILKLVDFPLNLTIFDFAIVFIRILKGAMEYGTSWMTFTAPNLLDVIVNSSLFPYSLYMELNHKLNKQRTESWTQDITWVLFTIGSYTLQYRSPKKNNNIDPASCRDWKTSFHYKLVILRVYVKIYQRVIYTHTCHHSWRIRHFQSCCRGTPSQCLSSNAMVYRILRRCEIHQIWRCLYICEVASYSRCTKPGYIWNSEITTQGLEHRKKERKFKHIIYILFIISTENISLVVTYHGRQTDIMNLCQYDPTWISFKSSGFTMV